MQRPASPPGLVLVLVLISAICTWVAACAPQVKPKSAQSTADAGAPSDDRAAVAEEEDEADGDVEAEDAETAEQGPCPHNMVLVEGRFCIDKYEASLVETAEDGSEHPYAHYRPVDGHVVRAVSEPDVFPQGYISEVQAEDACAASGKRLCTHVEWKTACMGPAKTTFPYGDARQPGTCHDTGKSAVGAVFGAKALAESVAVAPAAATPTKTASKAEGRRAHVSVKGRAAETTKTRPTKGGDRKRTAKADSRKPSAKSSPPRAAESKSSTSKKPRRAAGRVSTKPASVDASVWTKLNDPALGQVDGALAKTGSHAACVNGYGVVDMVGNLHEWVATDPAAVHGTFAGGYYLDTSINGDGCNYRTVAHAHEYHDYSTGFRCCAPPKP